MKKLLMAIAAILLGSSVHAADAKFGVVDMQRAILSTKAGKTAQATMKSEIEKRQKEMEKMRTDFEAMLKDFRKKALHWSDDLKAKKGAELQREE
ncbi:MAG: OmpH family outer membrane protein [Bdellovibrionales bacterium]